MEEALFGVILFTERYENAVTFYRDVMGLPIYRQKDGLTGFLLGPRNYLMVESGGVGSTHEKGRNQNSVVLRWDVPHLIDTVRALEGRGANFSQTAQVFSWGTIAVLCDPDGNRIEIGEVGPASASFGYPKSPQSHGLD